MSTLRTGLLALLLSPSLVHADALARLTPPDKTFFDDPIALSRDGRWVAALATDAASQATLEVWDATTQGGKTAPLTLAGMPTTATRLDFITPERVLVVSKRGDGRVEALLVSRAESLTADKKKLGPADAIEPVMRDGKRVVAVYEKRARKGGAEHTVTLVAADGHVVAHHTFAEDAESLLHTHVGAVRQLWWSHGHTQLAAQKIGEYDKQRDMRRPDRFVRLDTLTEKVLDEHEVEDVLAFTKVALAHKAQPGEETFVRISDDRKTVLLDTGLDEVPLPLVRGLELYEPQSLQYDELHDHELLVVLQVDPNNIEAVNRRVPDKDEIDLYRLDLTTVKQALSMPRVLVLPGQGRGARLTVADNRVLVLRKDRGFDRGGVAIELYALP